MMDYAVFLRAVNVGGTGKLPMADLKALCEDAGFLNVQTYIASGNVVLSTPEPASYVQRELERRLEAYAGKAVGVIVRTLPELERIIADCPYQNEDPKKSVVIFLDEEAAPEMLEESKRRQDEVLSLGKREIYVYFPQGMGRSKLTLPAAKTGTTRNMNTVRKLHDMLVVLPG